MSSHSRSTSSSRKVGHATSIGQFQVAVYSKASTKAKLKKIVEANATNPPIDMQAGGRGPYGTPEEIRNFMGFDRLIVYGPRQSYVAKLNYDNGKWKVQ